MPSRKRLCYRIHIRKRWGIVALALFPLGANLIVTATASGRMFDCLKETPRRHTAIVLGARVYRNGTPSIILRDRLDAALSLYRAGKVKKILVTGDHRAESYDEVTAMHRWLREQGVPNMDIFLDHAGFRTFDSMARAAKVFGVDSAVICTQAFHLPRAIFLAEAFGIEAVGLASDRHVYYRHYINHMREFLARTFALLDAYIWHREPRFLGARIAIDGDGRVTQ